MKKWLLKEKADDDFVQKFSDQPLLITQLLYNRGLKSQSQIDLFFEPAFEKLYDPFLFVDMPKAVDRIWQAIEKKQKILIHGDYDADGVTSSAVLFRTLTLLGAKVEVFIPHREDDGYGLNENNLKDFADKNIALLITVDCGVTNVKEIEILNQLGLDVVITDHHEPLEVLPPALAIINPKVPNSGYPFTGLAGVGVAYKVVLALLSDFKKIKPFEAKFQEWGGVDGYKKWLLDLVAVGTVADVVPLIDENRILVKWGLIVLAQTKNLGLKKLLEIINTQRIDTFTIGFQIAPRINASGRMNHAKLSFELLIVNESEQAEKLAQELHENNLQRQKAIEQALVGAKKQVENLKDEKIIFVYEESWLPGVIGLIAGRLSDEFYRPVFAMTLSNGSIIGSGRSIEDFNIVKNLSRASEFLARFGGHAGACGFTLTSQEIRETFELSLKESSLVELDKLDLTPVLRLESKLNMSDLSIELIEKIDSFGPYGEANPRPLFWLSDLQITAIDCIGKEKTHLRILVKQDTPVLYKMLWFSKAKVWADKLNIGDIIEVACEVGINEWNGRREIEFRIVDLKEIK